MSKDLLITGGSGMVGNAIKAIKPDATFISSSDYDLRDAEQVESMFRTYRPRRVIHLAAKVGGVKGNADYVNDFFTDNILINTNVLKGCVDYKVKKVVSLLSTCVYPDKEFVSYPLTEDQLHCGEPHSSNFGYAYAKRMLEVHSRAARAQHDTDFVCAIPNNIFGLHDNFDLENGHVLPALIRKFWEAKNDRTEVTLWGNGSALREFTHASDIARAILWMLWTAPKDAILLNIGNTEERSIKQVAETIAAEFNYPGEIIWDTDKPSGQHRKPSSNAKFLEASDFKYTSFDVAIKETCDWFKNSYPYVRGI